MTLAVVWILAQMDAPIWVIGPFVIIMAIRTVIGLCRFVNEYGGK